MLHHAGSEWQAGPPSPAVPLESSRLVTPRRHPADAATSTPALLHAIRLVIRSDSDPARQALFATLLATSLPARVAHQLHGTLRATPAGAALIGGLGLVSLLRIAPPAEPGGRVFTVARHANARRQTARLCAEVGIGECRTVQSGSRLIFTIGSLAALWHLLRGARLRPALRFIRRIDSRHGFLVACRVAVAIAWYVRSTSMLRARRPAVVLVSSDSNPEEIGFLAAARALGIAQVFISHAYPTYLSPPLDFTLSILEGDAAVQARERKGPIRGAVVLGGVEGESRPMDAARLLRPEPVIGIFTSKALSWPTFAAVVDDCRRLGARRILIRWHPSMLEPPNLSRVLGNLSDVVETPASAMLADVASQCDWVVADENSNVHLQVLKLGIPTIAIARLGVYPESRGDQYGFVTSGVVPMAASLKAVDRSELADFFSGNWAERFARYDASYLRDADVVATEVRDAVWALILKADGDAPTAARPRALRVG